MSLVFLGAVVLGVLKKSGKLLLMISVTTARTWDRLRKAANNDQKHENGPAHNQQRNKSQH
eukprot:3056778-Amphidinium_carterae.1